MTVHDHDFPELRRARAVVFDVDGTLYHGPHLRRRILLELAAHCLADPRRLRLPWMLQTYRREREKIAEEELSGVRELQYTQPAARLGVPPEALEQTVQDWIHERPLRHLAAYRIRGARRLFAAIRASGRQIGVVSDYPAAAKLAALDLEADRVVCGTDPEIDRLKPHPKALASLVSDLGRLPEECLVVGDREDRDGAIARRLGIPYLVRTDRPRGSREFADFIALHEAFASGSSG